MEKKKGAYFSNLRRVPVMLPAIAIVICVKKAKRENKGDKVKRIASAPVIITIMSIALFLGGCAQEANRGSLVKTALTLRNSTDYEIESFGLQFMGSARIKRINPMDQPVNYDGSFADDLTLKPGEEVSFVFSVGTNELPEPWGVNMNIAGVESLCCSSGTITFDGVKRYEITLDDSPGEDGKPQFLFTAFSD
jgi:hypothetical protein